MILKCLHCNDEIKSLYRHDFKMCTCGKCFIDGGNEYTRVGGNSGDYALIDDDADNSEE